MPKTVTCYTITVTYDASTGRKEDSYTATINNHLYPGETSGVFTGRSITGVITRAANWTKEN